MHGLRPEFQDRINFVILDYDIEADYDLASDLGVANHPAYAIVPPNGDPGDATQRSFGPRNEEALRELLNDAIEEFGAS